VILGIGVVFSLWKTAKQPVPVADGPVDAPEPMK